MHIHRQVTHWIESSQLQNGRLNTGRCGRHYSICGIMVHIGLITYPPATTTTNSCALSTTRHVFRTLWWRSISEGPDKHPSHNMFFLDILEIHVLQNLFSDPDTGKKRSMRRDVSRFPLAKNLNFTDFVVFDLPLLWSLFRSTCLSVHVCCV
jgi:hypothetical protein